ncbi:hypothetical protein BC936DRAFT_147312 [Jimgerdemannia flammicorona]|uniref:Uncharacterized protein n=1 Tax=Jimgerdemannia flammicorona TaxID=994334 RepID=A0A433D5L2_9FUNG|nr:hypothetical protein BC936DRAFT_147312 [Jimgerdemannia flammicorona]
MASCVVGGRWKSSSSPSLSEWGEVDGILRSGGRWKSSLMWMFLQTWTCGRSCSFELLADVDVLADVDILTDMNVLTDVDVLADGDILAGVNVLVDEDVLANVDFHGRFYRHERF